MTSKRRRPSAREAEARRLKAGRMLLKGKSQAEVARHFGITRQAVNQWDRIIKKKGINGLRAKKRSGRPTKAPKKAIVRLTKILLKGAIAYGFRTDLWTAKRVCKVFNDEFGIRYSPAHMTRLLHQCGLSYQKPARQAAEKDKKASDDRIEEFLPIIKREAHDDRRYVKKAVNWALRQIGKRSLGLNKKAIKVGKEIQEMGSKSAKWIASDPLRELTSDAVKKRLVRRESESGQGQLDTG